MVNPVPRNIPPQEFSYQYQFPPVPVVPENDRRALAERNRLDESDEAEQYRLETPASRLKSALIASTLSRQLALAVGNHWSSNTETDLIRKAALYVRPLRSLIR